MTNFCCMYFDRVQGSGHSLLFPSEPAKILFGLTPYLVLPMLVVGVAPKPHTNVQSISEIPIALFTP